MIKLIDKILNEFKSCFTRNATFKWFEIVNKYAPIYKEEDYIVLVGDGVKESKEIKKMPNGLFSGFLRIQTFDCLVLYYI